VFFLVGGSKCLVETVTKTNTGNWGVIKSINSIISKQTKNAIIPQKMRSNHWLYAGQNKVKIRVSLLTYNKILSLIVFRLLRTSATKNFKEVHSYRVLKLQEY
jgi:hypothetical protein